MNAKIKVFVSVLKRLYICYYLICMTVLLIVDFRYIHIIDIRFSWLISVVGRKKFGQSLFQTDQ